jgi:predicted dehydrogenase
MKKIRWGIIGFGDIVQKRVFPAFKELDNCEVTAICRANKEVVAETAKRHNIQTWYYDWRDMINDSSIEALYIATPVYLHAEQTIAAAKTGKHILCEKPMAMNENECREMIDACKINNVHLSIAYYRHFYPVIDRIKELIAQNTIGNIVVIEAQAFDFFNRNPNEPRFWLLEKNKSGGGPMMDFGCHRIEIFLNIAGPIINVSSNNSNTLFERDVEDTSTALFAFGSGAHGLLSISHAVHESKDTLNIYGTKGSLHIEKLNDGVLKIITKDGEKIEHLPPHDNLHLPHIRAFTDAIINNTEIPVPGETGLEVNRLIDKIYGR